MWLRRLPAVALVILFAGSAGNGQSASDAARAAIADAFAANRDGIYREALPLAERAVALAEPGEDRQLLARALAELGRARWGRGQYDAALSAHERALTIFRDLDDHDGEAEVLLRSGETRYSLGRYQEALAQYELALKANERMPVPSRGREASIRSNIGVSLRFVGRLNEAAAAIEHGLAIARELGNEGFAGQALVFLGITNRARAEYQKAIDAYTEAIAIRRKLKDRRGEAQALGNLGNVYHELGEFEKAIEAHTQSLAIAEEVGYTAQVGFSTSNLAIVLAQLGREALPRFEQALAVWRQIDRQAEVARTLRAIGIQRLQTKGDPGGARTALDEALTIARRIRDADAEGYVLLDLGILELAAGATRPALARFEEGLAVARALGSPHLEFELLSQRGRARLEAGDREAGIADLRASVAIVNDIRARVTSDDAKIAFVDTRQAVFRDLADALLSAGRPIEALEAAEAGRARAFADVLQSRLVRPRPAEQGALDDLRAEIAKPAGSLPVTTTAAGSATGRAAGTTAMLDRLRRQNEELASLVTADSAGIDEIRATAKRLDATIVEYLVTPRALLAWVVSPNGEVRTARTDVTDARLAELARDLLGALDTAGAAMPRAGATPPGLRELHRFVILPVAQWLPRSSSDSVVIVPHGALTHVPFAALEDAQGVPMVTRHTLSIAPSASLFRYTSAKRRAPARGRTSMIFAAPETPRDAGLAPLPGSLDEGRRVAARLADFTPTLLTGARATEQSAKRSLGDAAYLHFATHGLVSEIRPADSSLVLTAGSTDDGYLRAAEIYGLQLTADLVVLSGCSTARGRLTGDGVFGLPRAFIYAGAPSIVASLWDVSDEATVFLIDRFYAELLRTGNKAGALRSAQLATRQRYPHPALWAPFVLIGEPR